MRHHAHYVVDRFASFVSNRDVADLNALRKHYDLPLHTSDAIDIASAESAYELMTQRKTSLAASFANRGTMKNLVVQDSALKRITRTRFSLQDVLQVIRDSPQVVDRAQRGPASMRKRQLKVDDDEDRAALIRTAPRQRQRRRQQERAASAAAAVASSSSSAAHQQRQHQHGRLSKSGEIIENQKFKAKAAPRTIDVTTSVSQFFSGVPLRTTTERVPRSSSSSSVSASARGGGSRAHSPMNDSVENSLALFFSPQPVSRKRERCDDDGGASASSSSSSSLFGTAVRTAAQSDAAAAAAARNAVAISFGQIFLSTEVVPLPEYIGDYGHGEAIDEHNDDEHDDDEHDHDEHE